jgi:dTMP kinase
MRGQPAMTRGSLIALEGLDGVGKTTQARLVALFLGNLGLSVILTREPTNGPVGQKIRRIIAHGRQGLTPAAELDLFVADRREHVDNIIKPALAEGKIVITDRYYFSSLAYQGALGLDPRDILRRHEDFAPPPDLVIILELPLPEISRRLQQRGLPTSFEKIDYLAKVAAIFEQLNAPCLVRVNGLGTASEVNSRILAILSQYFNLPQKPRRSANRIDLEVE